MKTLMMCLALMLSAMQASALNPQKTITQFTHRSWGAADGISTPYSMAQTTDGYIWLSTTRGIYRFDGIHFTSMKLGPSYSRMAVNPPKLLAGNDNALWMIQGQNVMRLQHSKLVIFGAKDGLPGGNFKVIFRGANGTIWAGGDGGLAKFNNGKWHKLGAENNLSKGSIHAAMLDRSNTLWIVMASPSQRPQSYSILFLRHGETQFQFAGDAGGDVYKMVEAHDGKIWLAQIARGVRVFIPGNPAIHFVHPEIHVGSVNILFDRDDCLWITTMGDGLRRVRNIAALETHDVEKSNSKIDSFTEKDGLTSDMCGSIMEDREGNIWVGTIGGLDCFSENKFTSFSTREGLPFDQSLMLQATPDGSVWAGTSPYGFLQIKNGGGKFVDKRWFDLKLGPGSFGVFSLYTDPMGDLLLGTGLGVLIVHQGSNEATPLSESPRLDTVLAMTSDHDGGLWLCDYHRGVYRVFGKESKALLATSPSSDTSPTNWVMAAYTDNAGRVWLGFYSGVVACYDGTLFRWYSSKEGLAAGVVRAILSDSKNQIWVAGSEGISRYANGRFQTLTSTNGLPDDNLFTVIQDNEGFFWLAGYSGLFRVSPDTLDKAFSSRSRQITGRLLGTEDGLRGFVQGPLFLWGKTTAAKSADGRLWFSTGTGLAMIDPHHISKNDLPPPVFIQQIIANGKVYQTLTDLKLPEGTRNCEFDYAGLSYVNTAKVRYKYKLEGYDTQWVDAGTRHQAFYSNLKPKNYKFCVIACNNDGVWNETGSTLAFSIMPAFYQTTWFPFCCLLVVALSLVGLHRLRLAQLSTRMNLQLKAQENERKRIAQELHDTLLQGFTGIGLKLEALANKLPSSMLSVKLHLKSVLDQSDQFLTDARRAIWKLRSSSLEKAQDFSKTLQETVGHALDGAGIHLVFSVTGTPRKLESCVEDNLLRICEEAMTNIIKHAQATHVQVTLEFVFKEIQMRIKDNGRGFNPQGPERYKAGHFGLVGIEERVKLLNGKLTLNSMVNRGTDIVIAIQAK